MTRADDGAGGISTGSIRGHVDREVGEREVGARETGAREVDAREGSERMGAARAAGAGEDGAGEDGAGEAVTREGVSRAGVAREVAVRRIVVRVLPRGASAEADRALLPSAVAELLGIDPSAVTVLRRCENCGGDDHGRPVVAGPAHPPVWASLSRAGGLVAVAATSLGPVGIDIESLERVATAGFDDVAFSATERESLRTCADPTLRRAQLWSAKEAVLKARGTGLRVDPREVDAGNPAHGIRVEGIEVPAGYAGSLAYGTISSGSATA